MTDILWITNKNRVLPVVKYKAASKEELKRRQQQRQQRELENLRKQRERTEFVIQTVCQGVKGLHAGVSHICRQLQNMKKK